MMPVEDTSEEFPEDPDDIIDDDYGPDNSEEDDDE